VLAVSLVIGAILAQARNEPLSSLRAITVRINASGTKNPPPLLVPSAAALTIGIPFCSANRAARSLPLMARNHAPARIALFSSVTVNRP
jgi:hypothetical protein